MSKKSEAKAAQGYNAKPFSETCGNCVHFASDITERPGHFGGIYTDEKNLRCGIGGFAVKKMATCAKFAPKVVA